MSEDKVSRQESILESIRQGRIQRIDFLGDSITQGCGFVSRQQGYPDFLLGKMKQLAGHDRFQTYNHAVGGATAADGAGRLHWCERTASPPDLSFVMFGLNDVYQSVSEEDYGESLGAIVSRLKHLGSVVVVLGPTPSSTWDRWWWFWGRRPFRPGRRPCARSACGPPGRPAAPAQTSWIAWPPSTRAARFPRGCSGRTEFT